MSRDRKFSSHSYNLNRNLWEETPKSDYHRHVYDNGFQSNSGTGNFPVYSNLVNSSSEYDPTFTYFKESNCNYNNNIETSYRPSKLPSRNAVDHLLELERMRLNTYDYFEYPTSNNLVQPYESNVQRNYRKQDEQYKSEYERYSNVLNTHHSPERKTFNNSSPDYHYNNSRKDINRPIETRPPSPFGIKTAIYTSTPRLSFNSIEENSNIPRINYRLETIRRQSEMSREILCHRSPLTLRTKKRPNVSSPSLAFEYKKIKINQHKNCPKLEIDRRSEKETIEMINEFQVNPENEKVISVNKKSEMTNSKRLELVCPHCNLKYFTSTLYLSHLKCPRHLKVVKQVVLKRNDFLRIIRVEQRRAQKILEENVDGLESRQNFCPTCKLYYQQSEAAHKASKYHIKIKKIMEPYCKICNLNLQSHVAYEYHICSLEHLKKKARPDLNKIVVNNKKIIPENINVMDEKSGKADDVVIDKPENKLVIVGREEVYKVEAYYCKLCKMYLPQVENDRFEEVISAHCSTQYHLKLYYANCSSNKCSNRNEVLVIQDTNEENLNEPNTVIIIEDDESNKCISANEEKPLRKEPTLEKHAKQDILDRFENNEDMDKLENFENKIFDEVDKTNLQENVNINNQVEPNSQESSLSICVDDKQWVFDIYQDLTNNFEKAEKDKSE